MYTLCRMVFVGMCAGVLIGCGGSSDESDPSYYSYVSEDLNATADEAKDEPLFSQQWYLSCETGDFCINRGIDPNATVHMTDEAYENGGKGITIAIIDDGLDVTHPEISDAIIYRYDSATGTSDVAHTSPYGYHGTAVTGIIASRVNERGVVGVASKSKIIFLKYSPQMSDSAMIELFEIARKEGADVINCSWGTYDVSDAVKEEIRDLATNGRNGKGIVIVFAAGNDDQDMGNDESAIDEVIAVGASNESNDRAWYSNYGPHLDLLAPGGEYEGITTIDPLGEDRGVAVEYSDYLVADDPFGFVGTSAAAPIVTGAVAILLAKNPELTRKEVEEALHRYSDKIGDVTYIDGFNRYYGYGKINVSRLLEGVATDQDESNSSETY